MSSKLAVMLDQHSTAAQRDALQAMLEGLPKVTGVTFVDRHHAFQRLKTNLGDANGTALDGVSEENMPESFESTVTDSAFSEAIASILHKQPGVTTIVMGLTSLPLTHGVVVQVADRDPAMEAAIAKFPTAKSVKFESADAALTRLKKLCHDDKALADALTRDNVSASYRFVWTEAKATAGEPGITLSKLDPDGLVLGVPESTL